MKSAVGDLPVMREGTAATEMNCPTDLGHSSIDARRRGSRTGPVARWLKPIEDGRGF